MAGEVNLSMEDFISDAAVMEEMASIVDTVAPLEFLDEGGVQDLEDSKDINIDKQKIAEPDKKAEIVGKEKTTEIPPDSKEKISSTVAANTLYSSFAKSLKDKGGILKDLDETDVDSFDKLSEKIEKLIEKEAENRLNDTQKELKEALGIGMPIDEFTQLQQKIDQLSGISDELLESEEEDSVKLRYNIIKANYVLQGMKEDKADKLAKLSISAQSDIEDAKTAAIEMKDFYKDSLKTKKEEYKQKSLDAKSKEDNAINLFKEKVYKTEKIAEFELTENIKEKIFDTTTKIVAKKDGKPLNAIMKDRVDNPEEFDLKLNFVYSVTNGFKDFSYFMGKGEQKKVHEFDNLLKATSNSLNSNAFDFESVFNLSDIDDSEKVF